MFVVHLKECSFCGNFIQKLSNNSSVFCSIYFLIFFHCGLLLEFRDKIFPSSYLKQGLRQLFAIKVIKLIRNYKPIFQNRIIVTIKWDNSNIPTADNGDIIIADNKEADNSYMKVADNSDSDNSDNDTLNCGNL